MDDLPPGIDVASWSSTQGAVTRNGETLIYDLGSMAAGQTASMTLAVRPRQLGVITNVARVVSAYVDPTEPSLVAQGITTVLREPPMSVAMVAGRPGVLLAVGGRGVRPPIQPLPGPGGGLAARFGVRHRRRRTLGRAARSQSTPPASSDWQSPLREIRACLPTFSSRCSSRSCRASAVPGESVIRSVPFAVFGNAMTSRMLGVPQSMATNRSNPRAMPPCGGAP